MLLEAIRVLNELLERSRRGANKGPVTIAVKYDATPDRNPMTGEPNPARALPRHVEPSKETEVIDAQSVEPRTIDVEATPARKRDDYEGPRPKVLRAGFFGPDG